jgi:hypothetical protein
MNKGGSVIDSEFVLKLFANQTFRDELARFNKKEMFLPQIYNPKSSVVD